MSIIAIRQSVSAMELKGKTSAFHLALCFCIRLAVRRNVVYMSLAMASPDRNSLIMLGGTFRLGLWY
jgi:hypothetical protein